MRADCPVYMVIFLVHISFLVQGKNDTCRMKCIRDHLILSKVCGKLHHIRKYSILHEFSCEVWLKMSDINDEQAPH